MKTFKTILVAGSLLGVLLTALPGKAGTHMVTLEMAYMPIVPCSQLFVIEGMGWAK